VDAVSAGLDLARALDTRLLVFGSAYLLPHALERLADRSSTVRAASS
jgi:hypothetical protein